MDFDLEDRQAGAEDTQRTRWIFRYKPAEVLAAAQKMVQHHIERRKWWDEELAKAEANLKAKGFEYREQLNSIGREVQIVGDPQLAHRVAQCKRKSDEHRASQETYETWVRALKGKADRQPGEELELRIGDLVFFGL